MTERVALVHRKRFEASLQTTCKLRGAEAMANAIIGLTRSLSNNSFLETKTATQ